MNADDPTMRVVDWLFASVVLTLTTIMGAIQKVLWGKVEKLETERSETAVLSERVSELASAIERLSDELDEKHTENVTFARGEQERTRQWREVIMAPALGKLTEDAIRLSGRVDNLEYQMRTKNRQRSDKT